MKLRNTFFMFPQVSSAEFYLGVDGGGSKTRAAVVDGEGKLMGEGAAGASNPMRVGVSQSAMSIREAVAVAYSKAGINGNDIAGACIGLAGARHQDMRRKMREALSGLCRGPLEITTDARVALHGAAEGEPAVIVIAGTGSISCGLNSRGKEAYAGGWGPIAGDEGSGVWIAKKALQQVAQSDDGRSHPTILTEAACRYFGVSTPRGLAAAIYAPGVTNERIAGFGKEVILSAQEEDHAAMEILARAGKELGELATTVIVNLDMRGESFPVAYTGGVFGAGELILRPLREAVAAVAPHARVAQPLRQPVVAAALMARGRGHTLALAG